jgi:Ependymin
VVAFAAIAVSAQQKCESPTVWEGRQLVNDPTKNFARSSAVFYDAPNERIATIDEIFADGQNRTFYHTILNHPAKKMYLIDITKKTCETRTIDFPWRQYGIPANATFFGDFEIGSDAVPGAGVQIQRWGEHRDDRFWEGTFTSIGCLPVHDIFFDKRVGVVHTDFFDLVLGISDPNVFVPPPFCN